MLKQQGKNASSDTLGDVIVCYGHSQLGQCGCGTCPPRAALAGRRGRVDVPGAGAALLSSSARDANQRLLTRGANQGGMPLAEGLQISDVLIYWCPPLSLQCPRCS